MDSLRGNRKVLPNYLLDDYVPPPETKGSSNHESKSSVSRQASTGESSQQHLDGLANGSTSGEASDTSAGPLGFLPRRKKKLRQACVYCRRSHLVCEEKRPCHRCVKRGIADRCVDPPQEGQLLQDSGWTGSTDASSGASSLNEKYVSPPPVSTLNNNIESSSSSSKHLGELAGTDGGQKRKRKLKSEDPRGSTTESHRPNSHLGPQPDYNRHHGGFELAGAATPYGASADHGSSTSGSSSLGGVPASTLSSAMPPTSAHPPMPAPMQMQAEPTVAGKSASSQLLQGQPIFQPPSSAELDSLFSTYFFDVADAFSMRPNGAHHPHDPHEMLPPHPVGQVHPHYHHQQHPHAHPSPNLHRQDGLRHQGGSALQAAHHHRVSYGIPAAGPDPRSFLTIQQQAAASQHQLRQDNSSNTSRFPPAAAPASSLDSGFADTVAQPTPSITDERPKDDAREQSKDARSGVDDVKETLGRQKPGDVYSPYPYRKGYASLMRYMTEQNWSEQSIRSVEAALSKVRRLWFSLEDNIQPSSMIQLQAEWAGNVRYFTESVLPFTPVPMLVCRKAGEVYASNQLAQDLFGRSRDEMTGGKISSYELMTEDSASKFFRLYELAVGGTQAEDGTYVPTVGKTSPLYWNAEIVRPNADGSNTVLATRGIFEMKIAPCGLPSLLVCCFIPLS